MEKIYLREDYIKLGQALKAAGFVENLEGTEHSYNFHGEEWKCIEMKLNKKKDVF